MSEKHGITMTQARKMMNDAYIKYYDTRKQVAAEGKGLSPDHRMDKAMEHMKRKPYGGKA